MPQLSAEIMALLAGVANIVTQMVKGLIPDQGQKWIPLGLILLTMGAGVALTFAYGRDPIAGLLEGLFGGASAVGFYELASKVPGFDRVWNGTGWITK